MVGNYRGFLGWNLVLTVGLVLLLAACGPAAPAPEPAAPPVDMAEMRDIVQQAVTEANKTAANPGEINPAEIKAAVESAVGEAVRESAEAGLSAEEIGRMVENAVAESAAAGITAEQVESMVVKAVEEARNPGELVVYSGRSETLVDPIIQQFAEASGIDVRVKYANTVQLAATLLEEGGNSPADVYFAQDPGGLGAVEELLAPLPETILSRTPDWAHSPAEKWVGISGRARTVVYGTDRLSEEDLPDDMFGFTDPKWKGRIGWAPTNASFQTMVTAMRAVWGEERAREWLEGIQANEPKVYPKNTPQVAAAASGEIDVGFVNHYYLFRFIAEEGEDFPARNYHPRAGGPGSMVMVAGAGILETSENRGNAEKFLSFLLSDVGQQYFASQTFEYPLVENVKVQRVLIPLAEINAPEIALAGLADLKGTHALLRETGILP